METRIAPEWGGGGVRIVALSKYEKMVVFDNHTFVSWEMMHENSYQVVYSYLHLPPDVLFYDNIEGSYQKFRKMLSEKAREHKVFDELKASELWAAIA